MFQYTSEIIPHVHLPKMLELQTQYMYFYTHFKISKVLVHQNQIFLTLFVSYSHIETEAFVWCFVTLESIDAFIDIYFYDKL